VVHGDISVNNFMWDEATQKAILNDFDLAALMEPGSHSPHKTGFERTCTKPFMALQLLEENARKGLIPRRYRHELESFAWCFVWIALCVQSGEDVISDSVSSWVSGSHRDVRDRKLGFLTDAKFALTPDYVEVESLLQSWMEYWDDDNCKIQRASRRDPNFQEHPEQKYIGDFVDFAKQFGWEAPFEMDWVDVKL